ncbi:hypothetical protein V8C86DRAFT_2499178, partial [Haematococcus lacustris]
CKTPQPAAQPPRPAQLPSHSSSPAASPAAGALARRQPSPAASPAAGAQPRVTMQHLPSQGASLGGTTSQASSTVSGRKSHRHGQEAWMSNVNSIPAAVREWEEGGGLRQPLEALESQPGRPHTAGNSYYAQQLGRFKDIPFTLKVIQRQRSIATLTDTAIVVQAEADAHFQQLAAASGGPNKKRTSRAWSGYLAWLEEAYPQQVSVARRWKQDPSASDAQVNAMLAEAQLPKAVLTTPMKQLQQTRAATGNAPPAVGWVRKQLAFPTAPDSQLVAGAGPSVGLAAARLAAAPPEEAWAAPSAGSAANELAVVSPPNESGVGPSTGLASAPLQGGAGMTADSDIAAAADVLVLKILKGVRDQTGADVQPQVLKNVVSRIATNVKKEVAKALRLPLKADAAGKKPLSGYALFSGMKRAENGNAAIAAAWQGAAQDVYAVYAAIVNNLEGRAGY